MVQLSEEMVKKYRRRIKQYEKTLNDEIDIQGFIMVVDGDTILDHFMF
ncbi:hypothetical protein KJ656_07925 [bacterium]|nr:hypothetical protein [bacterium]